MLDYNLLSLGAGAASGMLVMVLIYLFTALRHKKALYSARKTIEQTRQQIDAERRKRMADLQEELGRKRADVELELKKTHIEIERLNHRYQQRETVLKEKEIEVHSLQERVADKERELAQRLDSLDNDTRKINQLHESLVSKLESVANLKRDEARKLLIDSLEEQVTIERKQWLAKYEEETRGNARHRANTIVAGAMQRYLTDIVTFHSSSVVNLPNEEMKGRIIGKDGRNIKALEMATGIEFVIGDAPEVITLSGFNPIRRAVAKRALELLVLDGRINPTRIEETVEQCEREVEDNIVELGQQTVIEFGLGNVHPKMANLLGRLHYRTSFTQNVLIHSKEVAYFSRMIASELGLDGVLASRCGLFHDIGKAVSAEVEGPHAIIGADMAREYGEDDIVVNAIAAHHEEVPNKTIYDVIVQIADTISAARPGARRETLSTYVKRLEQLEAICTKFNGVKKSYALQAGREVRVIVDDCTHDDDSAVVLARDIAKKIESEMNFPGQIKVSVIREKRIIEYAK